MPSIQSLLESLSIHPTAMDDMGPLIDDLADLLVTPSDPLALESFRYSASEFIAFEGMPR